MAGKDIQQVKVMEVPKAPASHIRQVDQAAMKQGGSTVSKPFPSMPAVQDVSNKSDKSSKNSGSC